MLHNEYFLKISFQNPQRGTTILEPPKNLQSTPKKKLSKPEDDWPATTKTLCSLKASPMVKVTFPQKVAKNPFDGRHRHQPKTHLLLHSLFQLFLRFRVASNQKNKVVAVNLLGNHQSWKIMIQLTCMVRTSKTEPKI